MNEKIQKRSFIIMENADISYVNTDDFGEVLNGLQKESAISNNVRNGQASNVKRDLTEMFDSVSNGQQLTNVINFTENTQLLISRSLSPAKVSSIKVNEDNSTADVYMQPDQVSLAIGKGGFNIKLAGMLTGYEIDVYRDVDEMMDDVAIEEFSDEIESWIINELKAIGCDSARSVLELDAEDLVKRTDLEIETVENVLSVLKSELETEEE